MNPNIMVLVFRIKPCKTFPATCELSLGFPRFLVVLPTFPDLLPGSHWQLAQANCLSVWCPLCPHQWAHSTCSSEHIFSRDRAIHLEEAPGVIDPGDRCFRRQSVLSLLVSWVVLLFFENRLIETFYHLVAYGLKCKWLNMLFNNFIIPELRRTWSLRCEQFQPWPVNIRGSCSFLRLYLYWAKSKELFDKLTPEKKRQVNTSNSAAFWEQHKT